MRRVVSLLGFIVFALGAYRAGETYLFTKRAVALDAEVVLIEELRGPPRPRSRIPIHLVYKMPDGTEQRSTTAMPLLGKFSVGDSVRVLADPNQPQIVHFPLPSVLWATPLTMVAVGALLITLPLILPRKRNLALPVQTA